MTADDLAALVEPDPMAVGAVWALKDESGFFATITAVVVVPGARWVEFTWRDALGNADKGSLEWNVWDDMFVPVGRVGS